MVQVFEWGNSAQSEMWERSFGSSANTKWLSLPHKLGQASLSTVGRVLFSLLLWLFTHTLAAERHWVQRHHDPPLAPAFPAAVPWDTLSHKVKTPLLPSAHLGLSSGSRAGWVAGTGTLRTGFVLAWARRISWTDRWAGISIQIPQNKQKAKQ